jgi:DnaJ-class molecular chaperone
VTTSSQYGIPTSKDYAAIVCDRDGRQLVIKTSEANVDRIISAISQKIPWIEFGYSDELQQQWNNSRAELIAAIDRRAKGGARGDDLRVDVTLDFYEAIFGCNKEVRIQHLQLTLMGSLAPTITELIVTIPAGVDSETRLRMAGKGDVSRDGGESGDLYIYLEVVQEEGGFRREGVDIVSTLKITADQARQGCKLRVNTIDGKSTIFIPPGTSCGDRLKMSGYGVPKLGCPKERGDHIICIDL